MAVVCDGTRPATNPLTRNVHFYVDGVQRGDGNVLSNEVVRATTTEGFGAKGPGGTWNRDAACSIMAVGINPDGLS